MTDSGGGPPGAVAALALMALSSAAQADASLSYVDRDSGAWQTRIAVSGDLLRVDAAGANGGAYVVLDQRTQTLTLIAPDAGATTSTTVEQLQSLINGVAGASDPASQPLVQLALENLPAEQRAEAEGLLRQSKRDEKIPYTPTGARDRIAGIACEVYEQRSENGDRRALCTARYADFKLKPADAHTLQTALGLLQQTGGPWVRAAQVPGLPILYSGSYGGQAYGGTSALQTIGRETLAPALFADPPGYRIVSVFEMMSLIGFTP